MTICQSNKVTALFSATKVPYGDDRVRGITVTCGHCHAVERLPVNNFSGRNGEGDDAEFNFISRKLEGRGWKVGRRIDQHRCPACFASAKATNGRRENVAAANGGAPVSITPIKSLKEAGQRLMGRDDRRIIFTKLNEVYVGDKVGYGDGWTDEKVAVDLGVPRAWVSLIREENFGDEKANDEIRQKLAEVTKMLDEVKVTSAKAEAIWIDLKRLCSAAEHLDKSLDAIRKAVGGNG